jgi:hypothetical protein
VKTSLIVSLGKCVVPLVPHMRATKDVFRAVAGHNADLPGTSRNRLAVSIALTILVAIGVGIGTAIAQRYLQFPWLSLFDAASPWILPMFLLGALRHSGPSAAATGGATGFLELVGYYVTDHLRGHPAGGSILLFWGACAVLAGPIFGVAGYLWWSQRRLGRLAGVLLAAAFLAEAIVVYWWNLGYGSSAVLFAVIGIALAAVLSLRTPGLFGLLRSFGWLVVAVPVGMLCEVGLSSIYSQTF